MGYLDYAGLQYLWGKLKEKFAPKSHTHDDRYYTEAEVNSKLKAKASSDHTHGLNSSSLTKSVDNATTNSWDMVGGNKDFLLRSLRMQAKAPDWLEDNYAAGIAFGGADTKGVISHAYNAPDIKFAGGNGAAPVWWLRLTGTSGKTYNLNAMPPASHTHNSIKDAGNNSSDITFAYSKAGMNYGDYTWLAGWNGNELRAVNKNQFATAGHTHSSIVGHTAGNGFDFGYSNSKDVTIPKETTVSTYYVKILSSTPFDFRFKKMYVKTVGDNTQYSFIAQVSANAYMQPHIELITQQYNNPEIKNIIVAGAPNYYHSIYLEIDSSTKVEKTISIQTDFLTDASLSLSKIKPSDIQLTVPIRSNDHISTSIPICADGGIWGNLNGKATSAGTADVANSVDWSKVQNKPATYAPAVHTHDDRYYTEAEINSKLDGKSNTGHTHDDRYYTETEINAKLNGKAPNGHTHQYLSLYGARPANINFTKSTNGTGAMFHFVATSSTTTGKPPADSSILQLNWDNNGGWDSQLALSTTASPHVYYRNQQNGTWGNWSTLLDNLNYIDYAAKKEHTHTKAQITDFPASLKNPTALTIQTNGAIAATYDGSAAKTVNITKGNIGLGKQ